ncbi:translocation/assembly module TamB domain-containing protein [Stutzerimonas tarimensis]|uniref:Translocation/assembly module TamB domain-containing protein n=1 Tax=Stutzerimonas tarimensis TaxID=1507735 RepID=A0ABV7T3A7_9GAMM
MKSLVKWVLLGLLVLLLIVLMALGVLLGSEAGARWALSRAPGVEVIGFQGRLGGQWRAERLVWVQDENQVVVEQPHMRWRPSCLLQRTLCIDHLSSTTISLTFPPSEEEEPAEAEPPSLPELRLPLALEIGEVDIGRVTLNDAEQLRSAQLRADWRDEGLDIHRLQVIREDVQLQLAGRLDPHADWPLRLQGNAALALVDEPWTLDILLEGQLKDVVKLQVTSHGFLNAEVTGQASPMDERLPASLRITSDDFKASPDLPDSLRVDTLELTATGDMQEGYRLLGNARLAGDGGAVALVLDGLVTQLGARFDELRLDAGDDRWVRVSGRVDWEEELEAEAKLQWRDFPWQRLYPMEEEPPVALGALEADLQYAGESYLGNFQAQLSGPAGDFSLGSPVSGDLERVHLPQLVLIAGQGRAEGNLSLGFAEGIDWSTRLQLSELDPAYWVAELPGRLGGSLVSEGELRDERLRAQANLDLQGQLRDLPTRLRLEAAGVDQRWEVPVLDLSMGDNRVSGSGRLAEALEGALELDLARLAQLWPGLAGEARGQLGLAGTLESPQGRLDLSGRSLAFENNRIESLQLQASLSEGERGQLSLRAASIDAAGTSVGDLTLEASGTQAEHSATLSLEGPLAEIDLAAEGGLHNDDWRGRLASARIEGYGQQWVLRDPATVERRGDGRVLLGAHCWSSAPATLCADDQRLLPDPQLRYRLRDFPLDSLAEFLPEDFAWQGEVNADLEIDLPEAGPQGFARIDAGPGVLRLREADQWLDFPYTRLSLETDLTPQYADAELRFEGGDLGTLVVQGRLDPQDPAMPMDGEFMLRGLDLGVARSFVPQLEELQGVLSGDGQLSGTLEQPLVNGQLSLRDGLIGGSELPLRLEALQVQLFIEGQGARLAGDWRSGERGRGQLGGTLGWGENLEADLTIDGQNLPITVEPYARLEASTSLRVRFAEERLAVSGKVDVPRGLIEVRELPPATVQVSPDVVIVGEEEQEPGVPLEIAMDIDVDVGRDRLQFVGFGLTADLRGFLHIGDDLDTRGELNLVDGRYRAYGQRLTLRRAQLLFVGPVAQPFLDIEAIRSIDEDDVVVGLRITGSAAHPRVEIFSEPGMNQDQALAYLVLGRPLGADGGDSNMLAQAALSLGLAGSAPITGAVADMFGIRDFQIDTEGSGDTTSVVASGQLTERLSLRYGVGVFQPGNTIALRYRLTRRLFLEAASGLASSLDLFYRRDF